MGSAVVAQTPLVSGLTSVLVRPDGATCWGMRDNRPARGCTGFVPGAGRVSGMVCLFLALVGRRIAAARAGCWARRYASGASCWGL